MQVKHLHQNQVAERWCMSPRTLERWRWLGIGPQFLKIGNRVTYRLEDIEQYEASSLRSNTAKNPPLLSPCNP